MTDLHVWTDGHEWCIATSAEDARECARTFTGEECESTADEWRMLPDDKTFTLLGEGIVPDVKRTAKEWVETNGRGYLGGET